MNENESEFIMPKTILSVIICTIGLSIPLVAQNQKRITGFVSDSLEHPIIGATVIGTTLTKSGVPIIGLATTDTKGAFSLSVPPGLHTLCVTGVEEYLDPCQWAVPTTVNDLSTLPVYLKLEKGTKVVVRVNDPKDLGSKLRTTADLTGSEQKRVLSAHVLFQDGRRRTLTIQASGMGYYEYSETIPSTLPFLLNIFSPGFSLLSSDGRGIPTEGLTVRFDNAAAATSAKTSLPMPFNIRPRSSVAALMVTINAAK